MWFSVPVALAAAVSAATPVFAQDWAPMTSKEDGFRAAYPGQPSVETIGYTTDPYMGRIELAQLPSDSTHQKAIASWK